MNKVIIIGGGKGGVGKSMVSQAVLDMLREQNENELVYVETDDANPDVYKAVNTTVKSEVCNLDNESGYVKLGSIIEQNPGACIVINTAARTTTGLVKHGSIIADVVREMGREMAMLWPINRQRDCLELLKQWMDECGDFGPVYVLLNTYFGDAEKFNRYLSSKLKDRVNGTVTFPELNDLVADKMTDNRMPLWADTTGLTISERSVLSRYRREASKELKEVLYG